MKIAVDKEKCTGCGLCKEVCPKGPKIWSMNKNKKACASNLEFCHLCINCASRCPEQAIHVIRDAEEKEKHESK